MNFDDNIQMMNVSGARHAGTGVAERYGSC